MDSFTIFLFVLFIAVFYTVNFHLILWFENKGRLKKSSNNVKLPFLSIIMPAYNEEKIIGKSISSLLQVDYPKDRYDILVVDDGSTDGTYDIVSRFKSKNLRVFKKINGGKASALNFGLKHAAGEFVVTVDADSFVAKNALKNCVKYFDEPEVAAVTSRILVKNKSKLFERIQNIDMVGIALLRKTQEYINAINATPGPLSVFKKAALIKVGAFDEKNLTEDAEISWRLIRNNYKVRIALDAYAYSIFPSSVRGWFKQRTRWVVGGIQTLVKHMGAIKEPNGVRNFLIPNNLLGYILVVVGLFFVGLRYSTMFFDNILYFIKSFAAGVNPFEKLFAIEYVVNVNTFFALALVTLAVYLTVLILKFGRVKFRLKEFAGFMVITPLLYFYVTAYGILRYFYGIFKKNYGWFTK